MVVVEDSLLEERPAGRTHSSKGDNILLSDNRATEQNIIRINTMLVAGDRGREHSGLIVTIEEQQLSPEAHRKSHK